MMSSKERMLTSLALGIPDRVPATVHQWQPLHLKTYLDGISDQDAFRRFGLDASLARFGLLPDHTPDWSVETRPLGESDGEKRFRITVTTPGGTLEKQIGQNDTTVWDITHLIKRHEDLKLVDAFMPVPRLDRDRLQQEYDRLGDAGIMRGFVSGDQGGCWQHACCLVGTEKLIYEAADHPDWVHALLSALLAKKIRFIEESLDGAAYDLIETGGGAASSTVISPQYFEEFCLPYDRRMHDALHDLGHRVVYHTCGGMMPLLELIVRSGCDASETLTPPSMGGDARPQELKQRIGADVALIGGLDQTSTLEVGTPDQIRRHVREMFEAYGPGGGYIMSPSDHFFHMSAENLEAYARAARECVY